MRPRCTSSATRRAGGSPKRAFTLWRGFCAVSTLHPLVYGTAYVWKRGEQGAVRVTAADSSASFATACEEPLDCLGARQLRGVAEPQMVFAARLNESKTTG
jgi:hypothetical protein